MLSKFVKSLKDVDLSRIKMPMAVVYDGPKDFPEMYLCRIWEGAGGHPTDTAGFLTRFPRTAGDDPVIVETWMK